MLNTVKFEQRELIPSKIVCVGRNYIEHIYELGDEVPENMVLFAKSNAAISDEIKLSGDEPIHFEGEICFIYEGGGFSGVGFGLDLTKRELQGKLIKKGLPWERAKAFDGAAVFSEFISFNESSADLNFELKINNESRQLGKVAMMIYKPHHILQEIESFMTLVDGDIVMTGTPKGVGPISEGDVFEVVLKNGDKVLLQKSWQAKK